MVKLVLLTLELTSLIFIIQRSSVNLKTKKVRCNGIELNR